MVEWWSEGVMEWWDSLEFDGVIGQATLRATGSVDVRVIGVNVAATLATKDAIFAGPGLEPAPAKFRINPQAGQAGEHGQGISQNQVRDGHWVRRGEAKGSWLGRQRCRVG